MKSLKTTARWTGLGYLIIFISGFFANFYTLEGMLVDGNATQTAENISTQISQFQMGVAAFSIMIVVDILLAFPLYRLLKSASIGLSFTSSAIRVLNGLVFVLALTNLFAIIPVAQSESYASASVMTLLGDFNTIWNIGLLFFGAHLLLLGWLIIRSVHFPKVIGGLILLAAMGYLLDSGAQLFLSNYAQYQSILEMLVIGGGVLGEFSLTIWLLVKGVRNAPIHKPTSLNAKLS